VRSGADADIIDTVLYDLLNTGARAQVSRSETPRAFVHEISNVLLIHGWANSFRIEGYLTWYGQRNATSMGLLR
jgi:hypothetical protein